MNINLNLNSIDKHLIEPFINLSININVIQLNNIASYLNILRKYKNPKTVICNHNNILQAVNYKSDDNINFWIIIDNQYNFIDIGVPNDCDLNNNATYNNMSENDSMMIQSIKDFLN
jgi:hypothetical protein